MTFKDKYKEELSDIRFAENFEENTLAMLSEAAERKENIIMINKRKTLKVVALAIATIMILAGSAVAVINLLRPSDVAGRFDKNEIATFFDENYFESVTEKNEVYTLIFMGMAPGEDLWSHEIGDELALENRTYAVFALYRNDGEPLSHLDDSPIHILPVMDGYRPTALLSLGMSHSRFSENGVLYYLYDYTDLEVFADKNLRLVTYEGTSPYSAITSNDKGEIVYAEGYNGFKAVFELDLDESKADPEAAAEFLSQF